MISPLRAHEPSTRKIPSLPGFESALLSGKQTHLHASTARKASSGAGPSLLAQAKSSGSCDALLNASLRGNISNLATGQEQLRVCRPAIMASAAARSRRRLHGQSRPSSSCPIEKALDSTRSSKSALCSLLSTARTLNVSTGPPYPSTHPRRSASKVSDVSVNVKSLHKHHLSTLPLTPFTTVIAEPEIRQPLSKPKRLPKTAKLSTKKSTSSTAAQLHTCTSIDYDPFNIPEALQRLRPRLKAKQAEFTKIYQFLALAIAEFYRVGDLSVLQTCQFPPTMIAVMMPNPTPFPLTPLPYTSPWSLQEQQSDSPKSLSPSSISLDTNTPEIQSNLLLPPILTSPIYDTTSAIHYSSFLSSYSDRIDSSIKTTFINTNNSHDMLTPTSHELNDTQKFMSEVRPLDSYQSFNFPRSWNNGNVYDELRLEPNTLIHHPSLFDSAHQFTSIASARKFYVRGVSNSFITILLHCNADDV